MQKIFSKEGVYYFFGLHLNEQKFSLATYSQQLQDCRSQENIMAYDVQVIIA